MPTYTLEAPTEGVNADGEVQQKKTFEIIEDGTWVDAKVLKIEEVEKPYKDDDGVPVRKVEFTFGFSWEGQDRKCWGETSTNFVFHPGCKLRNWAQEILVAELPEEFVLNTDHLETQPCRIQLGVRSWDTPKSKGSKNFVEDVMRPRGADLSSTAPKAETSFMEDPF